MSFLDWMNISMVIDIAFIVFSCAAVWKFRKLQKEINITKENIKLVAKNPQKAKRILLKETK